MANLYVKYYSRTIRYGCELSNPSSVIITSIATILNRQFNKYVKFAIFSDNLVDGNVRAGTTEETMRRDSQRTAGDFNARKKVAFGRTAKPDDGCGSQLQSQRFGLFRTAAHGNTGPRPPRIRSPRRIFRLPRSRLPNGRASSEAGHGRHSTAAPRPPATAAPTPSAPPATEDRQDVVRNDGGIVQRRLPNGLAATDRVAQPRTADHVPVGRGPEVPRTYDVLLLRRLRGASGERRLPTLRQKCAAATMLFIFTLRVPGAPLYAVTDFRLIFECAVVRHRTLILRPRSCKSKTRYSLFGQGMLTRNNDYSLFLYGSNNTTDTTRASLVVRIGYE